MGTSERRLGPLDTRDTIVDYLKYWSDRSDIPMQRLRLWLGLASSKLHTWKDRYVNSKKLEADAN